EIRLYLDVNNNDAYDAGDILVATAFSDGDTGNYCFEDVTPGEYVVVEIQPQYYDNVSDYDHTTSGSDPDGNDQADGPDNEIPVTLDYGENDNDNDFIDAPQPGIISGYVNDDANAPINAVHIYLYHDSNADGNEDGAPIDSVWTDTNGFYQFTGVVPGRYVVVEKNPLYYGDISDYDHSTSAPDTDGDDSSQGPDNDIPVLITPAETDSDNDFVDGRPGTICGSVRNDLGAPLSNVVVQLYLDLNGNGNMDSGEPMIASVMSDGDTGNYCFEDVTPGNYVINEIQLPNYGNQSDVDATPDPDGDDGSTPDNNIPVVLAPNENDADNNFVDIVCPGLPHITGFSTDTICSGEHEIFQAMDQGVGLVTYSWSFGSGSAPGTGSGIGPHDIMYTSNPTNSTIGATVNLTISKTGCTPATDSVAHIIVNPIPNPAINASTSNLCYFAPRTFKPSDVFHAGYTYSWNFGSGAEPATATGYGPHVVEWHTTGVKTVTLIVWSNAPGSSCGDTATISFNVVQCLGNITGTVRTTSGTGIQNVNVRLFPDVNLDGISDGGSPVKNVFTSSTGVYSMASIVPGQYVIVETQPSGYNSVWDGDETNDNDTLVYNNSNDNVIPVTVEPQEIDANNTFIESPTPGMITGTVFQDLDGDQVPDTNEGLSGVQLK
ncbi:MAG TPA: hypothetical protein VJ508_20010, partial [Saprospiraceae bacterium]|nr:hypothetical protein [Saprospiraceae bacterium]